MVLIKEYRCCMPISVEEYKVGQLYMIARHSLEQSEKGTGVEVVKNEECEDEVHGKGQYTEKRIHLSSKLPYWMQAICPQVFYVTEKAWNFYPYTKTEYTCSFVPKLNILIHTKYEDNQGDTENIFDLPSTTEHQIDKIDIAFDEISAKHYKESEDPKLFKSKVTNRGPLIEMWQTHEKPIMCSYKLVHVAFEVWGLQTKVESYIHSCIREILLLGHRQAFTWIDEWYNMSLEDVREYESRIQKETNEKVLTENAATGEEDAQEDPENVAS
ncbi:cytoplasmic phosphatidylinositol transfer protein 1 [Culicoides brevitarsis]|uniref:cytoplasmic phosphatidylinositol transfer protein 1 n=1 Tax=Culicoides brevitarsis TaxID=469753 RepID=UPI00307B9F17